MDEQTFQGPDDAASGLPNPAAPVPLDIEGNGSVDLYIGDIDRNTVPDSVTIFGADGSITVLVDGDESGTFETIGVDREGDGIVDSVATDTTGDGLPDVRQELDPATGEILTTVLDPTAAEAASPGDSGQRSGDGLIAPVPGAPEWSEPETVQAGPSQSGQTFGDGEREIAFAQDQSEPGFCGPASIAMILTEFTGMLVDDVTVATYVIDSDLMIPRADGAGWSGMSSDNLVRVLEAYGVEAQQERGDLDVLRSYLAEHRDIILAVDSSEVWGWQEQGLDISDNPQSSTADRSDHFLVITEIDDATGMVTLNDPGLGPAYGFAAGTGQGIQISIELLDDAWADSGRIMVVTEPIGGPEPSEASTPDAAEMATSATTQADTIVAKVTHPGLVFLPSSVSGRLLELLAGERDLGLEP